MEEDSHSQHPRVTCSPLSSDADLQILRFPSLHVYW